MELVTIEDVKDLIFKNIEDVDTPMMVIEALRPYEGKKITKKILEYVKNVGIGQNYYPPSGYSDRYKLVICTEKKDYDFTIGCNGVSQNIKINIEYILQSNPAYFSAATKRNNDRASSLQNHEHLNKMAEIINTINKAVYNFKSMTKYGEELYTSRNDLRKLVKDKYIAEHL